MEALADLFTSPYIWSIIIAYLSAQTTKFVLDHKTNKNLTWRDYFASGGMPSSHSASVVAPCMLIGLRVGFGSPLFAFALVVTVIICYDACSVRRSVGEYGLVINEMIKKSGDKDELLKPLAKDLRSRGIKVAKGEQRMPIYKRGHLPSEVVAGAVLGILVAILVNVLM